MINQDQPAEAPGDLDELTREVYARFGLAYFQSELLFQSLVQFVATGGEHKTRGGVVEGMVRASGLTLGLLVAAARHGLEAEFEGDLERCVERRNFLAHGFWYERLPLMYSVRGLQSLLDELDTDGRLFTRLHEVLQAVVLGRLTSHGITLARIDELAAAPEEVSPDALPDRRLPKLGEKVRMVSAWQAGEGVLFEDADGQLWQVSELGLGWYVGPDLTDRRRHRISDGLPADIVVRPKGAKRWDYALQFDNGVRLVVAGLAESGRVRIEIRTRHGA